MTSHFGDHDVSRETVERLEIYEKLLIRWQKRINLVANSTIDDAARRHFHDSLQMAPILNSREHVVDLGSGGGFPGLIIAIILAERGGGRIDLIESVGKKCAFLREVVRETGLNQCAAEVHIHNERVETCLPTIRDVSLITARALSSLTELLNMTEGRILRETRALFPKGVRYADELRDAERLWDFEAILHSSKIDGGSVIIELHNVVRR